MLLVASAVSLNAAEPVHAKKGSPEFERMKSLVGTWTGKTEMPGQGVVDLTVQYRLLAGGSVLEERCFQGTPGEMITMYYDQVTSGNDALLRSRQSARNDSRFLRCAIAKIRF